ncbi:hypothetical protein L1F30_05795 [Simiduia sp. 21SJ11W-1]|uniref:DUF4870 family protein n=1 Tax=Simiduia sp. 21SJ11W-1 TaxID=2909669 RepID=UPI00209EE65E|nr:hypothetical protein [Simiduia sp. 21SJ11W-1]UTA49060.1 hypothetical protein L1F30_05795 [Simiduia sp. 21SJ11W-1]
MNDVATSTKSLDSVKLVYVLYLASILLGVTSIIGLIMAYVNKDGDTGIANNHYRFQIRTFWMSLLYFTVSFVTIPLLGLGVLLMFVSLVWFIIRCVKGLKAVGENREIDNVTTWLF